MHPIIDRRYCITHPRTILRNFGAEVLFGMVISGRKSLLERAVEFHGRHGVPFPGEVGRAYRIAALIEFRVADLYRRLAQRFARVPRAAELFRELSDEELEHGRLMQLCRYTIRSGPRLRYLPTLRDPVVRAILTELRTLRGRVEELGLDEALEISVALEQGEINALFDRLLAQSGEQAPRLFAEQLRGVEDHARSVPRRIAALRRELAA